NLLSGLIVGVLTALGLLVILLPQVVLHKALAAARDALIVESWRKLVAESQDVGNVSRLIGQGNALKLYEFVRSVASTSTWLYNPTDLLVVLGTWLIPIATLVVQ